MPHKMVDADRGAFAFSHTDGQVLSFVLMDVDTSGEGIAFGIGQRVAYRVAAAYGSCLVALLHGKHNVLYADVRRCAKPDGKRAADVLFLLWHIEAHGVAPLPTFFRQWLVTMKNRAARAGHKRRQKKVDEDRRR